MGDNSAIEWTDATWNWATGCTKISPGCDNCYMYRLYPRLKMMGNPRYRAAPDTVTIHEDLLDLPLKWSESRMIFTCSMSDFFHEKIPDHYRDLAIETIRRTPRHIYQVLTKRSWIMKNYGGIIGNFPDNMWLGEDSHFKFRLEHLRRTHVKTRFVSFEPLVGPVGRLNLEGIHWAIVGGESGPRHRLCSIEWIREIRDQCETSGVAFFFKQWGGIKPKSGGRILDGKEWNEFPLVQKAHILV
jgi:protein gp37